MTTVRAVLAAAALLIAGAPAVSSRVSEWTIDPRSGLDEGALISPLRTVLAETGDALPVQPAHVGVDIAVAGGADGIFDLLITTTDPEADLSVRSMVRPPPSAVGEAVVTALAADLRYLQAARAGFPPPLYLPPDITDAVDGRRITGLIRTVAQAAGGGDTAPASGLEILDFQILDFAAHDRGVSVLLTGGSVELGPRFELTAATPESLLPAPLPPDGAAPHEIARTRWTRDLLAAGLERTRILRRRIGQPGAAAIDLPAGVRRLDAVPGGGLAALTRGGPVYVRLTERAGGETHRVPAATPFITAMDVDHQRRLVLYDPFDRRVVITGLDGREIGSVRPQVDPRMLPFPHAVAALADGSIVLGGSGIIWAFDRRGRPLWLQSAPGGGRDSLPAQFTLEPAAEQGAFYVLDGPRNRILRFGDYRIGNADAAESGEPGAGHAARRLAALALDHAAAAQEWGDVAQALQRADLAVALHEHALDLFPDDQETWAGLDSAVGVRSDAESVLFQERFLTLVSPDRLVFRADQPQPVSIVLQVENPGVVARTGVSVRAAGLRVPIGRIEPGQRVERRVWLHLPDGLLDAQEAIDVDLGVVLSADEPGGPPRRMFVTLPVRIPAPPWEQAAAGASGPRG